MGSRTNVFERTLFHSRVTQDKRHRAEVGILKALALQTCMFEFSAVDEKVLSLQALNVLCTCAQFRVPAFFDSLAGVLVL